MTANNKIHVVTLMRREKQTNTSVVYISTQKQRYKLNILRTLKLADCMDIIIRSYIITFTLTKDRAKKGQRPKCTVYYETAIFEHKLQFGIKHIELYAFTRKHLRYTENPFRL